MRQYKYSPLSISGEIRLLRLLPGLLNSSIHFEILTAPFIAPEVKDVQSDSTLEKLQATMPPHWKAHRTLEDDILFHFKDPKGEQNQSSWTHPVAGFDLSPYIEKFEEEQLGSKSIPTYEALSYTWGSPENPITAYVNTETESLAISQGGESTTLQIGQNVASALRHLRCTDRARILWVDAICVNQQDIAERNHQVKEMDKIYRFAKRVVVWLGPTSANSKHAMLTIEYLGRQVELTRDYHRVASPGCVEPKWNSSTHTLPYREETWEAIFDLLGRAWFSRLWILQEIQLGNRYSVIQCGSDVVEWRLFRRAVSSLNDKGDGPSPELRTRMGPVNSMCWVRSAESLTALLNMGRRRECSDPHDKVYAILGLIPPVVANKINPDYSAPIENVFREVFLAHLEVYRRLDLLQRCDNQERLEGLPSWVPTWTGAGRAHPIYGLGLCASSISSAHTAYLEPDTLEVAAIKITTISGVDSTEMGSLQDLFDALRTLGVEKHQETPYVAGGTLFEAYAMALCFGQLQDRFSNSSVFLTYVSWKDAILRKLRNQVVEEESKEPYFWHWVKNYAIGRRVVRTAKGLVGTTIGEAQFGDHVCVILGCEVPVLLRKRSDNSFEVVGECYIQGLMDGEGLLGPLPEPWKMRIVPGSEGLWATAYFNQSTEALSHEDPRLKALGPVPENWEPLDSERALGDPKYFQKFRNKTTGEVINTDPRFFPDAIKARGIPIETLRLV